MASPALACHYKSADDRQDVKNSMLPGQLDAVPVELGLADLMAAPNPIDLSGKATLVHSPGRWTGAYTLKQTNGQSVDLREGARAAVTGYLYAAKCQADGDYHLEIGLTQTFTGDCMIVEVPDPSRIADEKLRGRMRAVITQIEALGGEGLENAGAGARHVRVIGQLFIDARHLPRSGKRGGSRGTMTGPKTYCSTNVWELHPVTELVVGVP